MNSIINFLYLNYEIVILTIIIFIIFICWKIVAYFLNRNTGQLDFSKKVKATRVVNSNELVKNKKTSNAMFEPSVSVPTPIKSHIEWVESNGYDNSSHEESTVDTTTQSSQTDKLWKVLVVDDAYSIRKKFEKIMKGTDIDLILKDDGDVAFEYLMEEKPDLIITDIEMKRMNGIQLIEKIRDTSYLKDVPILVISSSIDKYIDLMSDKQVQAFINKPFDDEEIFKQIYFLLEN